jgi:hypothetical protein
MSKVQLEGERFSGVKTPLQMYTDVADAISIIYKELVKYEEEFPFNEAEDDNRTPNVPPDLEPVFIMIFSTLPDTLKPRFLPLLKENLQRFHDGLGSLQLYLLMSLLQCVDLKEEKLIKPQGHYNELSVVTALVHIARFDRDA